MSETEQQQLTRYKSKDTRRHPSVDMNPHKYRPKVRISELDLREDRSLVDLECFNNSSTLLLRGGGDGRSQGALQRTVLGRARKKLNAVDIKRGVAQRDAGRQSVLCDPPFKLYDYGMKYF